MTSIRFMIVLNTVQFNLGFTIHGKYINYDGSLYELNGIEYKVPYYSINNEFIIKSDGEPKLLISCESRNINKLITDNQLKELFPKTIKD